MKNFTQTSDQPYDQNVYALMTVSDELHSYWDDYEKLRDYWMMNPGAFGHVLVISKKQFERMVNDQTLSGGAGNKPRSAPSGFGSS